MQLSKNNLQEQLDRIYDAIGDLKVGLNQVAVSFAGSRSEIAVGDGALAGTQIWRDLRRIEGARPNLNNLPVSV